MKIGLRSSGLVACVTHLDRRRLRGSREWKVDSRRSECVVFAYGPRSDQCCHHVMVKGLRFVPKMKEELPLDKTLLECAAKVYAERSD